MAEAENRQRVADEALKQATDKVQADAAAKTAKAASKVVNKVVPASRLRAFSALLSPAPKDTAHCPARKLSTGGRGRSVGRAINGGTPSNWDFQ